MPSVAHRSTLILLCGDQVSLEPPLPVYLFNVVAGLRDKRAKGYPVKKARISFLTHDAIG